MSVEFARQYQVCWENPFARKTNAPAVYDGAAGGAISGADGYGGNFSAQTNFAAFPLGYVDIRGPMRADILSPSGSGSSVRSNFLKETHAVQAGTINSADVVDITVGFHLYDHFPPRTTDDFLITEDCAQPESYLTSLLTHEQLTATSTSLITWGGVSLTRSSTKTANTYQLCYKLSSGLYEVVMTFNVTGPSVEVITCLATQPDCVLGAFTFVGTGTG